MKKHVNLLLAALLGLSILGMPACGGSASSESTAEEPAAEKVEEPEEVVDPAEDFYGEWQLAAINSQGLTMVGDLASLLEASDNMKITISSGGDAKMSFDGETVVCTWEQTSDSTIVLSTPGDEADDASDAADDADTEDAIGDAEDAVENLADDGGEIEFTLEDGVLTVTSFTEEFDGKLYFSPDGKLAAYPAIDPANIGAADSVDAVEGDWTFSGIYFTGVTIYGDTESMAEMMGEGSETISISSDGTVEMMGETVSFEVGNEGGYIDVAGQAQLPVGIVSDYLAVDFTEAYGDDAILLYRR